MPFVANDYLAVVLMGLALFGNQWVAATYIGTVGDVVPQQLAGRVNGIAGLGDNGAALLAVLYTGVDRRQVRMDTGILRRRDAAVPGDGQRVPGAEEDRTGEVRGELTLSAARRSFRLKAEVGDAVPGANTSGFGIWDSGFGNWKLVTSSRT